MPQLINQIMVKAIGPWKEVLNRGQERGKFAELEPSGRLSAGSTGWSGRYTVRPLLDYRAGQRSNEPGQVPGLSRSKRFQKLFGRIRPVNQLEAEAHSRLGISLGRLWTWTTEVAFKRRRLHQPAGR